MRNWFTHLLCPQSESAEAGAKLPKVIVGMVHLPPLPGAPRFGGDRQAVLDSALRDAVALAEGGADALMMENYGDTPFFRGRAEPHTIAEMTAVACAIRREVDLPLGINVLRNDGRGALAVAAASGACFIRVNVLCGARVTDQGVIEGIAAELMRDRVQLRAGLVKVLADVDVKHSAPLAARPIAEEVADTLERGGADGLIVSGAGTGKPTDPDQLATVKKLAGDCPVFVGSGVSLDSIKALRPHADAFIVGTSLKTDGQVDPRKVQALRHALDVD